MIIHYFYSFLLAKKAFELCGHFGKMCESLSKSFFMFEKGRFDPTGTVGRTRSDRDCLSLWDRWGGSAEAEVSWRTEAVSNIMYRNAEYVLYGIEAQTETHYVTVVKTTYTMQSNIPDKWKVFTDGKYKKCYLPK